MKVKLKPGRYIVALSGGVDSVVLLDLLNRASDKDNSELIVAHFDHGIRSDSAKDRKFAGQLAKRYGLEFFFEEAHLGPKASEALAREKRYEFLEKIKDRAEADAIVTAHHRDDVLETIAINLLRGTGRKGLSSLGDSPGLIRPLVDFSKKEILDYAKKHGLSWQEDETNKDQSYLRNYVRHSLLKGLSEKQKNSLLETYRQSLARNEEIDVLIDGLFLKKEEIPRRLFNSLEHKLAAEVIAAWLRKERVPFDQKTIERIVISLKTAEENKMIQAARGRYFAVRGGIIRLNRQGSV